MGVYDAKDGKTKYARVFMQKMQCSCKNQMENEGKFKHAMVEIKYEITTDLPVGKGSKFRFF